MWCATSLAVGTWVLWRACVMGASRIDALVGECLLERFLDDALCIAFGALGVSLRGPEIF